MFLKIIVWHCVIPAQGCRALQNLRPCCFSPDEWMVYSHTVSNATAALSSITIPAEEGCGPLTSLCLSGMCIAPFVPSPSLSSLEANAYTFLTLVWNLILDCASFSQMKKPRLFSSMRTPPSGFGITRVFLSVGFGSPISQPPSVRSLKYSFLWCASNLLNWSLWRGN